MPTPSAKEPDFAAFIAIDWADREHAWAMQVAGSTLRETGKLAHTPEAIEAWAMQWATRFAGRPVAVALEQSRGALLYALQKYPHCVLYPIHPSTSYDYRKAMFPSGSKSDPGDAELLLDLLSLHRDRLRVLVPDDESTRKLQVLVEKRRQLVDERTADTNRITEQLKLYFPQILDWFDELHAPMVAAFLRRWPTLPPLQREDPAVVQDFFHQHGSRSQQRIQDRLQHIREATAAVQDPAVVDPAVLMVGILFGLVEVLNQGIRDLEKSIEEVASAHPDYAIFSSFPAAGRAMAPRLLAAFGSQRSRYLNASELQAYSGIAPVVQASGNRSWTHFRWACPKFLRQTFHEYARLSITRCCWARAFYKKQKAKGKGHHAAVRSLAFKWIRILFRCWQSRQPYQEGLYPPARVAQTVPFAPKTSRTAVLPGQPPPQESGKGQNCMLKSAGEILKSLITEA